MTAEPLGGRTSSPSVQRNHWFPYKYISARDLIAEQVYLLSHSRSHNRLLHGRGVVCGLELEEHQREECRNAGWVVVTAGIAIDAHGREIIVGENMAFQIPTREGQPVRWVVGIRYREDLVEQVPILYSDPAAGMPQSAANRIQESVEITAIPEDEFASYGWGLEGPGGVDAVPVLGEGGADIVPLALVVQGSGHIENVASRIGLDATRIVGVSWRHGGEYPLKELQQHRELKVWFDRPLRAAGSAHGVGENTFRLTARPPGGPVRAVASTKAPHLEGTGKVAVFEFAEDAFRHEHESYIGNATVHVEMLCDFILDQRGVPVSGRHLGGRLPSGDGRPGGTFESWFQVRRHD